MPDGSPTFLANNSPHPVWTSLNAANLTGAVVSVQVPTGALIRDVAHDQLPQALSLAPRWPRCWWA